MAAAANRSPCIDPDRSTSRQSAVSGRSHERTVRSSVEIGRRAARPAAIASRLASRSRSPSAIAARWVASRPMPRRLATPDRATSTRTRPARVRASPRSRSSVAPVRSARRVSASSGSSSRSVANSSSSRTPISGLTSAKFGCCARSRREIVRLDELSTAARASSPSTTWSLPPLPGGGGLRLFPNRLHSVAMTCPDRWPERSTPARARR